MQIMLNEQPAISAFAAARSNQNQMLVDVPVRFTDFEGILTQSYAIDGLNLMNPLFAPAGIHLVLCGDINKISDTRIMESDDIDQFTSSFSYTSGAMEVYIKPNVLNPILPPLSVLPISTYQAGNPNWNSPYPEHTNWIKLTSVGDFGVNFIHEIGHHFGLLHTFHVVAPYHVPMATDATNDFPYPVLGPNNQPVSSWWGRELAIRTDIDPNDPRPFKSTNYGASGDLIQDTPADCGTNPGSANVWPGCLVSAQDISTCLFNATLTYKDYNLDPISPPPGGNSLGHNFMSYWNKPCLNQFTPNQYTNLAYYNETARQPFYTLNRCGTFTDKVEFEGSATALPKVTLRVRHPNDNRICNVTSSPTGDYSGISHTDDLRVYAYHNGKSNALDFANDLLKRHYGHKKCEWKHGVDATDLFLINQHILAIQPLTSGYRIIAADANLDKSITSFDIVLLRKMLLEDNFYIPGVEQPWHFIPEFVPQNFTNSFNQNPFTLFSGGYLDQGWLFQLPADGKRGFDGIKIGDVNSSWPTDVNPCGPEGPPGNPGSMGMLPSFLVPSTNLAQNQTVKLAFNVQNFQQIKAFQLGLNIPFDLFEVLDIVDTSLPNFSKNDNFGLFDLENNSVKTLWFDQSSSGTTLQNDGKLFSIVVKTKQPIANLQAHLSLDNAILPNFFWGNTILSTSIAVEVEPASANRFDNVNITSLVKNKLICDPNPFDETLIVLFENEGFQTEADISITNVLGMVVTNQKVSLSVGENSITLNGLSGIASGVYTLNLLSEGKKYSRKIVKN